MEISVPTNDWLPLFQRLAKEETYQELMRFLEGAYEEATIYPEAGKVFQAFEWTPFHQVKVVLVGQDPYHGADQAHGLSFSVQPGRKIPPSLRNIYKELENDLGIEPVTHGYLKKWAQQGVLMLNRVLTVYAQKADSHRGKGWEFVTDAVVESLNQREEPVIFVLWGKQAERLESQIDTKKHFVLKGPHPSPLSAYRGFFGSKPFSQINQILVETGQQPIDWQLPEKL